MTRWWMILPVLAGVGVAGWVASAQEPAPMKREPSARSGEGPGAAGEGPDGPAKEKAGPRKESSPKGESFPGVEAPGLRLAAGQRTAVADARRNGLGYTSAPMIDVTQPRADTLMVSMTGMTTAAGLPCEESYAEIVFDLSQNFAVVTDRPSPRPVKLILEAQLMGLFRGNREGAGVAAVSVPAEACVTAGGVPIASVGFPGRSHSGKDVVVISDRSAPIEALVMPGEFCLGQKFAIRCSHPKKCFHKNVVTAMFGEAGRAPEWFNLLDPTRDLPRNRDLGFRVAIRVEPAPLLPAPARTLHEPRPGPALPLTK